jgi:hypothetical protein
LPLTKVDAQLLEGAINANSSGNVGIGTSSPTTKLNIVDGSATVNVRLESGSVVGQYFASSSGGAVFLDTASSHPLVFRTNTTERMRIDTNGVITSTLGGMQVISGTAVTASGTSVDFTGIPSWVKRVTVMFSGVSSTGATNKLIQIGSTSFATSGYMSSSALIQTTSVTAVSSTAGFIVFANAAADIIYGTMTLVNVSGNTWISNHMVVADQTNDYNIYGSGSSLTAISGVLDRVRITHVGGTDTFDAGTINIIYE